MSYEGLNWQVCRKGHYRYRDAYDDSSWGRCHCGAVLFAEGSIDQTNGDDSPEALDGWEKLAEARAKAYSDWLEDHPEESEVVLFQEGMIVCHRITGGIGVVCTCPAHEYEPAEMYVSWVIEPHTPTSVWLKGQESKFARGVPIKWHKPTRIERVRAWLGEAFFDCMLWGLKKASGASIGMSKESVTSR